jgi:hypothetical protein
MKTLFSACLLIIIAFPASAQLKITPVCNTFVVDILDGKVNDVRSDFTNGQIKEKLPCFTSEEPKSPSSKCGGGVFYKDRGVNFYTGREYVEIKENFKGKLTIPVMGASRNGLFKWLGNPKIKDVMWDAFETRYGTLVLYYNKANKVNRILFSKKSTDALNLCE